jgi:hypothetical protein
LRKSDGVLLPRSLCVQYYYAAEVWISNRNFSISFAGESCLFITKEDEETRRKWCSQTKNDVVVDASRHGTVFATKFAP